MTVEIIDLLEEVHVHHKKYQVAMIHLSDIVIPSPLIISQHLTRFRRQNFFQIAPIPYPGQCIRIGNLLKFKVLALQFQAMPAERLFLTLQFVLQLAHLVKIMARQTQQVKQFMVHPILLEEYQRAHQKHCSRGQQQTVGPNTWRDISAERCPSHHCTSAEYFTSTYG